MVFEIEMSICDTEYTELLMNQYFVGSTIEEVRFKGECVAKYLVRK